LIKCPHAQSAGRWFIGQNYIQLVPGQLRNELFQRAFPTDHADGLAKLKDRSEALADDDFRNRISHAHLQSHRAMPGFLAEGGQKLKT
jgi:hypothetical protein